IGQLNRPVGKLEPKTVPSFRPPTFGNPLPLNDDTRATSLAKHMAHCQAGLATADNQSVDKLAPHGRLLFHRHAGERESGGECLWRQEARRLFHQPPPSPHFTQTHATFPRASSF